MSYSDLPPVASDQEMAARRRVAAAVVEALTIAVLPAYVATRSDPRRPGAEVEVDQYAEEAGGVFGHWTASDKLLERFAAPLLAGEFDHPAILLNGSIAGAMVEALQVILTAIGFRVGISEDEYETDTLRILSS